jgi:hypothetical protein
MSKQILAVAALGSLGLSMAAHAQTAVTENTTVGGRGFIDFTNVDATSYNTTTGAATKSSANGIGADVTRFYLILDHTFDATWSANLTTDFQYSSAIGNTELFVKKAYLQGKFSDAFVLRAGSADLPWVPYAEGVYGYRYVEKVIVDRMSFGTSADWGLHALGKAADGKVNYAVGLIEGNGYKNPTRSKTLDIEGRINVVPVKDLQLAAGFYSGKRGQDVEGFTGSLHTASRLDLLAAYTIQAFKVGAEYVSADYWGTVTSATAKDKMDGFSVFANYTINPKNAVFARYDNSSKNTTTLATGVKSADTKENYYNVGWAFKPRRGIEYALVYKHDEQKLGSAKLSARDEVGAWITVGF